MLSMRKRTFLCLFALLGLTIACTGCGDGGKKKPKVAFVSNNAYQFWTFAEKGAEKAAGESDVELEFRKPQNGTVQVQREIIEDLINRGFTGVAVSPNEPANTLSFYKNTVAKKMSLVMTDNDLPDPTARKCYIGTHNYRAGRDAGELVKKAFPKGGKIAIFVGKADSPNAVERRQGFSTCWPARTSRTWARSPALTQPTSIWAMASRFSRRRSTKAAKRNARPRPRICSSIMPT